VLACPVCGARLAWGDALECGGCREQYPVVDGVPVLLSPASRNDPHKREQAEHHDAETDPEYEIRRPRGTPAVFGWMLAEKLRRGAMGIDALLAGRSVVTVCGGSGMDAEFLARSGARVIATDISLAAVTRARERGRRYGLDITPIVADAERLPLLDRSVDIAFVHDGLHHLREPLDGVDEMARVASTAVSVNEPARARLTDAAVRLGLAFEWEEAGNRIARMDPDAIVSRLSSRGFRTVDSQRYAMYHGHVAGRIARGLSRERLVRPSTTALCGVNRIAGGWGNKLAVKAVRI